MVILGGAKFETKLPLVEKFLNIADHIFIGGAMAPYATSLAAENPKIILPEGDLNALDANPETLEVLKEKKIRTVMTLHDYKLISPNYNLYHHGKIAEEAMGGKYYRCLVNNCMERWGESFIATIEAYFLRWNKFLSAIDWYLSPSRFLKDKFVQAGFPASKITVVPNPIEINLDQPYTEGDYITYIGRVAAEKGLEFLLQAAKQLPDLKFRIVGDGLEKIKGNSERAWSW